MKIFFLSTTFALFFLLFMPISIDARSFQPNEFFDTSITREGESFTLANQIIVAPLAFNSNETDPKVIAREIYFYLVNKVGFLDSPFHYFVLEDGTIIKANSRGDEFRVDVSNIENNSILVGYIGNERRGDYTKQAKDSIKKLILEIANNNEILGRNISFNSIQFIKNSASRTVLIQANDLSGRWIDLQPEVRSFVESNFSPVQKTYSLEILSFDYDSSAIFPEQPVNITMRVKNTGSFGIYENTRNEILFTKADGQRSELYDPENWISNSQIKLMQSGTILSPGEEVIYQFRILSPFAIGEFLETFELRTFNGQLISNSQKNISLNIQRPDYRIIQVPSGRGFEFMNVRAEPSSVANAIGIATPGQRFRVLEDAGNGYIKIRLPNSVEGWIAGWLVDNL